MLESDENSERVELPADFIALRDRQRVQDLNEVSSMEPEPSNDDENDPPVESMNTDVVMDEETIGRVIEQVTASVSESLSSELVQESIKGAINEKVVKRNLLIAKRRSEIGGLRRAITNAVNRGSCGIEKLAIISAAIDEVPVEDPIRPEQPPRDPRDRRKRMRSSCFQYVTQHEIPNSLQALRNELKLSNVGIIGMGLHKIYLALETSLDKPFEDTWSGVSFSSIINFKIS